MRPPGPCRMDTLAALVDGPGTTREIAQRTGWAIGDTRQALKRLRKSGEVVMLEPIKARGVKRPVPVYGKAETAPEPQASSADALAMLQAWSMKGARA